MSRSVENLEPLTSLRFFAAAAIVWLHSALYFPWAQIGPSLPYGQGVSFFFVLSGFIITHVYGNKCEPFGRFMWKRFARLWPVHLTTLLLVLLLVRADSVAFDGPGMNGKWWSFVANIALLQSWIPTTAYMFSWNSVSWSISTELFFYVAFPVLLILLRRSWTLPLLVSVAFLILVAIAVPIWSIAATGDIFDVTVTSLIYAVPLFRVLEFAVGMVTYVVWQRSRDWLTAGLTRAIIVDALAVVVLVAWLGWGFYVAAGYAMVNPVLAQWVGQSGSCIPFAGAIVALAASAGPAGWLLRHPILIKLGEISFALYMVHQLVMKIVVLSLPAFFSDPWIVLPTCLFAAFSLHYAVEKPAQRFLTRSKHPRAAIPLDPRAPLPK